MSYIRYEADFTCFLSVFSIALFSFYFFSVLWSFLAPCCACFIATVVVIVGIAAGGGGGGGVDCGYGYGAGAVVVCACLLGMVFLIRPS